MRIIYKRMPLFLRQFCLKIYGLISILRSDIWIVSKNEPLNTSLSIIYAGKEGNKNYLAKLAFNRSFSEIYGDRKWVWNFFRIIRKNLQYYDLIALEVKLPPWAGSFTTEKDFRKIYKDYYIKGLSILNGYVFGRNKGNLNECIPCELSGKMAIYQASSIF